MNSKHKRMKTLLGSPKHQQMKHCKRNVFTQDGNKISYKLLWKPEVWCGES
jgi:hypothetical protein